jgi:uncharacterized membrane protein YGL010W
MRTFTEQLTRYAAYHRDLRNVATHLVGVPMIVFAVDILLSRPVLAGDGALALTPAVLASIAAAVYYIALDRPVGVLMALLLAVLVAAAAPIAAQSTTAWLAWGVGLFVAGWIIQFIGHAYEGRKPAFVDDIVGLLIGPLFVVCEVLFLIGLRREVADAIERELGATLPRRGLSGQLL